MNICAYTCVCEEDRVWIPQYLAEVERLGMPFCIHFDRCSEDVQRQVVQHPGCTSFSRTTKSAGEFSETHKQGVFDLAVKTGADWAMAWDIDETWEPDFHERVRGLDLKTMEHVDCPWLNLWERPDQVRIDGPFAAGHRVKFYNLKCGLHWDFTQHTVNGAKCREKESKPSKLGVVSIHHGLMTRELRVQHKERWDRIYSRWVGRNPYGVWNFALDESITPTLCPLSSRIEDYR